jgi:hypothetical protein
MGSTVKRAKGKGIRRVSETATDAKAVLAESDETRQTSEEGKRYGVSQIRSIPQGKERWGIVSTSASPQRAQASLPRLVTGAQATWVQKCGHLGHRRFAWETDAQAAMDREEQGKPAGRDLPHQRVAPARQTSRGRPRTEDSPRKEEWHIIVATGTSKRKQVEQEAFRKACGMVGTTVRETTERSDEA